MSFDSVFRTPKKARPSEIPHKTDFKFPQKNKISKTKRFSHPEPVRDRREWVLESPFCRLLNDSEAEPQEKYQVLGREKAFWINENQIRSFKSFFVLFNYRDPSISKLFVTLISPLFSPFFKHENPKIEIIGESIHPLEKTLNALASNFRALNLMKEKELVFDEMNEDEEDVLVISGMGFAEPGDHEGEAVDFMVSVKFTEEKIREMRIKFGLNRN